MASKISPFLYPGTVSAIDRLSIVHLKRDLQMPTILKDRDDDDEGYSEGKVVNTRFGSFPHNTLIGVQWGTQVRASKVDTGSRGRRVKGGDEKKRKREESRAEENAKKAKLGDWEEAGIAGDESGNVTTPAAIKDDPRDAATGFIHLLPPTPENWTSSLPHRTQVVYTPDYSYILHRIRARPGTNLIEAGAGSGSFTHASARAVYNGYANGRDPVAKKTGQVWSYEFHEQRHEKLQDEIRGHGMEGVIRITHRDVCENGFLVDGESPGAESIFLDLPAPWLALPHLSRSRPQRNKTSTDDKSEEEFNNEPFVSPLNPKASVYICTFSPCIEQVQRTVSVMRQLGWVDIEMVEIAARRFEIRRDRVGIEAAQRGILAAPSSVDEAVARLVEVEGTFKTFHENGEKSGGKKDKTNPNSKAAIMERLVEKKAYKEGKLAHRTEPEIKTHTSYLVFAILPMEWSAEDEERAAGKWPVEQKEEGGKDEVIGMSRRQQKKAEKQAKRDSQKEKEAKADHGKEEGQTEDTMDTNE